MQRLTGAHMSLSDTIKTGVQRRAILASAIFLIGAAGAASALADPDPVDLAVVDRATGQPLPVWRHLGRLFIAGAPGARYSLRVTNHTDGRVLVVMSVDGVNILSGETAGYDQTGYVLDPRESYDVSGWRKSDTEVAAFSFAPLPQSYAARTGRPGDVGVIGMAVFRERIPVPPLAVEERARPAPFPSAPPIRPLAAPAPSALAAPPPPLGAMDEVVVEGSRIARRDFNSAAVDEKLGTAHGAREWSVVHDVTFERATSYPQSIRQIQYDTYDNLVASGVIPRGRSDEHRPRAFPSQPHGEGYVPDPPDDR